MRTSKEWWDETKKDSEKLVHWLKNQYHGEVTAAGRIHEMSHRFKDTKASTNLCLIAKQESDHATWIEKLLFDRNVKASILEKEERYWKLFGKNDRLYESSLEELAAIGTHAERMRLERIEVIANDETAPVDIRDTFTRILKDEIFHAKAFEEMTTEDCLKEALCHHLEGRNALGLEV